MSRDLITVNEGCLGKRILPLLPQVASNALSSGWHSQKIDSLKLAIQQLVIKNPILSGIVVLKKDGAYIEPGHYLPESHQFWSEVAFDQLMLAKGWKDSSPQGKLCLIEKDLAPMLPTITKVGAEAKMKSPLFHVYLIPLPDNHLFYSFRISHAVGDAKTYYDLISSIPSIMKGEPASRIDWDAPTRHHIEQFLDHMSPQDVERLYGLPLMLGILPRAIFGKPFHSYMLLSKPKIKQKKVDLKAPDERYLTSNDVIVAALCQSNPHVKVMTQIVNLRGKKEEIKTDFGGNFLQDLPFAREEALDPNQVHKITCNHKHYEANELPLMPCLMNQIGILSSWTGVTKKLEVGGTVTLAEVPPAEFVTRFPYDFAMITNFDEDHVVVLHNYQTFKVSELLQEIMA